MDNSTVERWRTTNLADVLPRLSTYAKRDASYVPTKDVKSERWHVLQIGEFELILTGSKFWDVRAKVGGGGLVDLTMHIWSCSYRAAVRRLREMEL